MPSTIKDILITLENKGYEAYVIGGYVRDYLLNRVSYDIDICTNATPQELLTIFPKAQVQLGSISFKKNKYSFEITTYREELAYANRRPIKYVYLSHLEDDLKRRDFTINTIAMNKDNKIINLRHGLESLEKKEIKVVGDISQKLTEDPLRIMRAIRLATILNFQLEPTLTQFISNNSSLILTLSSERLRLELDKIFLSSNISYGLELLTNLNIFKALGITFTSVIPTTSLEGIYAQLNVGPKLKFTNQEKKKITTLQNIIAKGNITKETIYYYGLELSLIGGEILGISSSKIKEMHANLPIFKPQDIALKPKVIIKLLNINYSKTISTIMHDLEIAILSNNLANTKESLTSYIINNRGRWLK